MHWFDITIFVLAAISVIYGFSTGLIMQLAILIGVVLGGIFSGLVADKIYPFMEQYLHMQPHIMAPASYILAFFLIMIVFCFLGTMIQSVLKMVKLNFINRLAGAVFNLVALMVLVSIGLNLMIELDRKNVVVTDALKSESRLYPVVQEIAPSVIPYLRFDWLDDVRHLAK